MHELPKEKLTAAQNLFQFGDGEKVVAVLDARMHEEHPNLVFVTASGGVKRTALSEFAEASGRQNGIVAMKLADDDRVVARVPGLGRLRAAARHRQRSGHPVRGERGAAGRSRARAGCAGSG